MVLSTRARTELHVAVYAYLVERGGAAAECAPAVAAALGVDTAAVAAANENPAAAAAASASASASAAGVPAGSTPPAQLLEAKWGAVVRLQRKVMELEARVGQLTDELSSGGGGNDWTGGGGSGSGGSGSGGAGEGGLRALPIAPAVHTLAGHRDDVTCVALHPRFAVAASGSLDAAVKVWDADTGELEATLRGHTNAVGCVAFSRGGALLASASADMSIKLWQRGQGGQFECARTLRGHEHSVSGLVWLPPAAASSSSGDDSGGGGGGDAAAGERLASCSRDKTVRIWDPNTGFCVKTISAGDEWVRCIAACLSAAAPSGRRDGAGAAGGGGGGGGDGAEGDGGGGGGEDDDTDGGDGGAPVLWMATGSDDQSVRLWRHAPGATAESAHNFNAVHTLRGHSHKIEALSFLTSVPSLTSPGAAARSVEGPQAGGRRVPLPLVASASRDKSIRVWVVATGECLSVLEGHENWVRDLAWHPSPTADQPLVLLSVGDDKSIRVWDAQQERAIKTINDAHDHFISSAAFGTAGGSGAIALVTGSVDNTVRIWRPRPRRS